MKIKIKKNGFEMYSGKNIECMKGKLLGKSVDGESYLVELNGKEVIVKKEFVIIWKRKSDIILE